MQQLKVIGFDADDTLWLNGVYFKAAEQAFCQLMSAYIDSDQCADALYKTEMKNMSLYGYGAMAFTLSLIETAIKISHSTVSAKHVDTIIGIGQQVLSHPVSLCPGVEAVLPVLAESFKLIVITKGHLLEQERKLRESGLLPYFHHIEVVSEKNPANYNQLMNAMAILPSAFLMVGDSLKSDIHPVLSLGAKAVHIPVQDVWQHEKAEKPILPYVELKSMHQLPDLLFSTKRY
jgi:putative hydrolase of the HAD superfamily